MRGNPPNAAVTASRGLDFYTYINHAWQASVKIKSYDSSVSVSDEIETRVEHELFDIIDKLVKTKPDDPFSKLVKSVMITKHQINNIYDIQRLVSSFECINNQLDVARVIGKLNRIQSNAPISFVVANDRYIPNKRCIYMYEPKLGLPEKQQYKKGVDNKAIASYTRVLKVIGQILNIESLESAVEIEASLLPYLSPENDRDDVSFTYNPHTLSELSRTYTSIPWKPLMVEWGMTPATAANATYIITNKNYVEALNSMFHHYSMKTWRVWMRAQTVVHFMKYLPPPFDDLHFQLWNKQLQGTTEKIPQRYLMLNIVKENIPHNLGRAYINHSISSQLKTTALAMVENLKQATIIRIRNLKWMTEETKVKAIEKCKAMIFQVAYPDKWDNELDSVSIDETRMLSNLLQLTIYDTNQMLKRLKKGKINEKENWEDGVFEVNAYYYSDKNMMVIPTGILQPPFFDLKHSHAWNFGGIGAAIGHEITHGFDDDGRLYNKTGVMNDWWSKKDADTYKSMSKDLVDLFNKATYMGGKVDGELTLSENIADLGGVSIALEALEMEFKNGDYNDAAKKKAYKEFFTSYAVSWRNKDRVKKAEQSLLLDKHAPAPLRVNLIVRQFAEFYTAFDIDESDPGYIPVGERIQLW
jgi:endothelin-converting enzyme/putative endopeptidase